MMDASSIPPAPRQSRFGWPLPDRREEFAKLAAEPNLETSRVADFKNRTVTLPILCVPINLPKYRISNGRTASAQQEWVANKHLPSDFFDGGDPELEEVQIAQHKILMRMIREEGLLAKFEDSANKQVEPLLLDENGFVVNGNRRLCCWRELLASEGGQVRYSHFGHIDVVVLPHCDDQELDRLEARLQVEKDIRSDYSWHAEANMMLKKQRLHGFTNAQLAQLYRGGDEKKVEELFAMRDLAAEYLHSRGKENMWSEVQDEFAFDKLLKARKATSSASDRELIKEASFALIDDPKKAGERLYSAIPKVREYLGAVKQALAEAFPLPPAETDSAAEAAFGGATARNSGDSDPAASELALVAAIKKDEVSISQARDVVVEVIRAQDLQIAERDAADFLIKTLKKANASLQNASGHGLRPESSTEGVRSQLSAIKEAIQRIETWLAEKGV